MTRTKKYAAWGKPFGEGQQIVCEITATNKKEAKAKLQENGVTVCSHVWDVQAVTNKFTIKLP